MERVHYAGGEEILVQYRIKAKLMGNTRNLQECARSDCPNSETFYAVRSILDTACAMADSAS